MSQRGELQQRDSNNRIALKRLTSFACRGNEGFRVAQHWRIAQHLILRKHSLGAKVAS